MCPLKGAHPIVRKLLVNKPSTRNWRNGRELEFPPTKKHTSRSDLRIATRLTMAI